MAIDRDPNMPSSGSTTPPRDSTIYEREAGMSRTDMNTLDHGTMPHERDAGGSNFMAFLIGGLVIAIGLLAFLFYDGGSTTGRDVNTTSSTTPRLEAPATPVPPATPSRPAQ